MPNQQTTNNNPKKKNHFWRPILGGTITAVLLFTTLLYFSYLNPITGLLIPMASGFVTLSLANAVIRSDQISQIFLPWTALVFLIPFSYWKLKILIILFFPIASLGGWLAVKLFTKIKSD